MSSQAHGQPHYGGAALWVAGAGAGCTAGFVVNRGSERGAITAGHCFNALDEGAYATLEDANGQIIFL